MDVQPAGSEARLRREVRFPMNLGIVMRESALEISNYS
jgi:hypothetical protein